MQKKEYTGSYLTGGGQLSYIAKYGTDAKLESGESPKASDYIRIPFRILSATIVGAGTWKSTEFSREVLLSAFDKLANVPAYLDHKDKELSEKGKFNIIGTVENPRFTEAKVNSKGETIPAGIDADFVINKTTNSSLATMLQDVNSPIRYCSAGLRFKYHLNIEKDSEGRSYYPGDYTPDGELVRMIVDEIVAFHEVSLVTHPADKYASILDSQGTVKYISLSSARTGTFQYSDIKQEERETFDKDGFAVVFDLPETLQKDALIEQVQFLQTEYSTLQEKAATWAHEANQAKAKLQAAEQELSGLRVQTETLKTQNATFTETVQLANTRALDLQAAFETIELQKQEWANERQAMFEKIAAFDKSVADKRTEVKRLYALSCNGKTDSVIDQSIEDADFTALQALEKQYLGFVDALYNQPQNSEKKEADGILAGISKRQFADV
jgi:FtsZ-binding cell division protein ZapB